MSISKKNNDLAPAIEHNKSYICSETLAELLTMEDRESMNSEDFIEVTDEIKVKIIVKKVTF